MTALWFPCSKFESQQKPTDFASVGFLIVGRSLAPAAYVGGGVLAGPFAIG